VNISLGKGLDHFLRAGRLLAWLLFLLFGITQAAQAGVQYVYDEAGRLVEAVAPDGAGAQYQYDPAGNITSIRRYAAGDLAIAEFTPDRGPAGATVTIYGVGFSATPSANTVKFNGVAATVSTATTTTLTTTVPAAATTGPITVAVGAKTAASASMFTVTSTPFNGAPTISAFAPTIAAQGAAVTITGQNFDASAAKNFVNFNITPATVTSSTAQQIKTSVPTGATSGPLKVRTAYGTATSSADFFVVPQGYTASQVGVAKRITVDGSPLSINTANVGKIAMVLFNGTQGQPLGLGIYPLNFTPADGGGATIFIKKPSGGDWLDPIGLSSATSFDLPALPETGSYTMLIVPESSHTMTASLILSTDLAAGVLAADGTAKTLTTTRIGQNARYTFNGTAGQNFNLLFSGNTFPGGTYISVLAPSGDELSHASLEGSSGILELNNLPTVGTYTVFISPSGTATGSISAALWADATGTLAVDGAATAASLPKGRKGRYTFTGAVGQNLGLGLTDLATTPTGNSVSFAVYKPDNSLLLDCGQASQNNGGNSCDLPSLAVAGTYTVVVDPGVNAATFKLWLSKDATGALTDGTAKTFASVRPGQNARYTFSGTAGQNLGLLLSGDVFPGTTTAYVFKPDGDELDHASLDYSSGAGSVGSMDLGNLPAAGTYTVFITPSGTAMGSITATLGSDITGTLTVDGTATAVNLPPGRKGRYSFTGSAGQHLGLGLTDLVTTPAGNQVSFAVYNPDNSLLVDCGAAAQSTGGRCDLPDLPGIGTYKVLIAPSTRAATFKLWLSNDATGVLTVGTAKTFASTRPGQNARYTFSGTAGQNLGLFFNGDVFPGSTAVSAFNPDGSKLASATLDYSSGTGTSANVDLSNLPANGTYTVFISPSSIATGSVSTTLWSDATGTLTVDGAATAASLSTNRKGRFTLTGIAGQSLGLGLTDLATTPAGKPITIKVYNPDGSDLLDCGAFSPSNGGGKCHLPSLLAAGIYTVLVDTTGNWTATFKLWLSNDAVGALASGAAKTFNSARPGQNARYTFNSTPGQSFTLALGGDVFPGTTTVTVFKPNGEELDHISLDYATGAGSSGMLLLNNLADAGTYTVAIEPAGIATGSIAITAWPDVTGTLAVDGAATSASLPPGRKGRYTFTGSVGQHLGLGLTSLATAPAGNAVAVAVYNPDNSLLFDCGTVYQSDGGGSCNLPALAAAGTYTVLVDTTDNWSATLQLWLSSDATGILANGTAKIFTSARPGQNARYTFSGTAGQNLSLILGGDVFPGSTTITVFNPNGSVLNSITLDSAGGTATSAVLDLSNLPAAGTYTVFISPVGTATGAITATLWPDIAGTLAVDGAATSASLPPNRRGRYTFTGSVGQHLGLGASNLVTTPAGNQVSVAVYKPGNVLLFDCGTAAQSDGGGSCDLPGLPAAGVYTVLVDTSGGWAATLNLWLNNDATGTLAVGTAKTFTSTRAGQNARYTFSGTAGQNLNLALSGDVFPGTTTVSVRQPDGSELNTIALDYASGAGNGGTLPLGSLPVAGTYTVFVTPSGPATGAITLKLQ